MIRYRECQRNHAAHLGGHVTDGCGEFMPAGDDGTPLALKCAACDCHRNFHRKESEVEPTATTTTPPPALLAPAQAATTTTANNCYISFSTPKHQLQPHVQPHLRSPAVMMAFGGGVVAESSSEDLNTGGASGGSSKKRFRTKFSQDQKDKMSEFAEKIGWRMQKQSEDEVQRFCNTVGVKRRVFKVWLHNNKQALKRKQS